jgi:2-iminobutanoate/2-iminopropanoate deaminase
MLLVGGIVMIKRMPTHCGDDTCSSSVVAGDFIFLSHHAGGFDSDDIVQINLYLKDINDFRPARDVFYKYFRNGSPARMTTTTDFVDSKCLCMVDAIAYKPQR